MVNFLFPTFFVIKAAQNIYIYLRLNKLLYAQYHQLPRRITAIVNHFHTITSVYIFISQCRHVTTSAKQGKVHHRDDRLVIHSAGTTVTATVVVLLVVILATS